jgi:dihydrofolate reductase
VSVPRRVIVSIYVTLDGFVDEPGLWSMPFWSDEAGAFKARELAAADALLLGRITYEGFAAVWPTMPGTGEFGLKLNGMPKHVASRTLTSATWNATIITGEVADAVSRLRAQGDGDLLVWGSGRLIDYLAAHDLIDEYRLMIHPIVLGGGEKRLFATAPRRDLRLAGVLELTNGIVVNSYVPAVEGA